MIKLLNCFPAKFFHFNDFSIKMTAIGVGRDTFSATSIANNLKYLGYDKVLAVSRLPDIPNRVLSILSNN